MPAPHRIDVDCITSDDQAVSARALSLRIAPDPCVRIDTNDYSLDPHLVGRRVVVRASQTEVRAVALDENLEAPV